MSLRGLLSQLCGSIEMAGGLLGFLAGLLQLGFIQLPGGGFTRLSAVAGSLSRFLRRTCLILQTQLGDIQSFGQFFQRRR